MEWRRGAVVDAAEGRAMGELAMDRLLQVGARHAGDYLLMVVIYARASDYPENGVIIIVNSRLSSKNV